MRVRQLDLAASSRPNDAQVARCNIKSEAISVLS